MGWEKARRPACVRCRPPQSGPGKATTAARLPPGLPITKALWVACGQALTSPTFKRERSEASQATEEGEWAELQKDLSGCRGPARAQIQEGKEGGVERERETAAVPGSRRVKNSTERPGGSWRPPTRTF